MREANPRVCHVSDPRCLAPAGYRTGNGIAYGDKSCRGTCHHCGEPVCAACSFVMQRKRWCFDCIQMERGSEYLNRRLAQRYPRG